MSEPSGASAFVSNLLRGKTAFVAGGTSGINLAIAEAYAAHGAAVAVMSRNRDKVDAAVASLQSIGAADAWGYAADVRDYDAVKATLADAANRHGALDVVISGAAGNFLSPAGMLSANAFKTVVEIDLLGTFHVFRAAYEHITKPGASLIAISAPQSTEAFWGQAHVCAAKAGVDMLVKSLANEWGAEGIRVNAVVPGPIDDTEGMARLAPIPGMRETIEQSLSLKHYGTKDDIAQMALFLASTASRYVTGTIMACDGGQLLGGPGLMQAFAEKAIAKFGTAAFAAQK